MILTNTHAGLACYAMHHIDNNDVPHQRNHILEVLNNCKQVHEAGLSHCDWEHLELAAVLHDLYSGRDRGDHHRLAASWIRENLARFGYDKETVTLVAQMCEEHRASTGGGYSNPMCMAFSAADRGPLDLGKSIVRSLGSPEHPHAFASRMKQLPDLLDILKRKFDKGGYARNNPIHEQLWGHTIEKYREDLNSGHTHIVDLWFEAEASKPKACKDVVAYDGNDKVYQCTYIGETTMIQQQLPLCSMSGAFMSEFHSCTHYGKGVHI